MKSLFLILGLAIIGSLIYIGYYKKGMDNPPTTTNNPTALIRTNKGDMLIELFADKTPITVKNFITLSEKSFYDETLFHRVIANFMIQGGDPNTRSGESRTFGMGGPGYTILDEFVPGLSNVTGTISMANSGSNTGGSQFFINVVDNTYLDNKHTVFGKVLTGMDVVLKISKIQVDANDLPIDPIRIDTIFIKK
ncbi:MAG: peptidylprolyl isomerase [Patescibacteria group bacterium]